MMLAALASPSLAGSKPSNLDRTWYVPGPQDIALPTITLAGGRLSGTDSCNTLMGTYQLKGTSGIRFMAAGTRKMCPDMSSANAFNAALNDARSFTLAGDTLILRNRNGKRLITLNALNK